MRRVHFLLQEEEEWQEQMEGRIGAGGWATQGGEDVVVSVLALSVSWQKHNQSSANASKITVCFYLSPQIRAGVGECAVFKTLTPPPSLCSMCVLARLCCVDVRFSDSVCVVWVSLCEEASHFRLRLICIFLKRKLAVVVMFSCVCVSVCVCYFNGINRDPYHNC